MGNVQDLRFAYYDGIDWRDTWDSTMGVTNLPNAVRVRIQMADANGPKDINQDPIELIVPLVSQSRTNAAQTTATSP